MLHIYIYIHIYGDILYIHIYIYIASSPVFSCYVLRMYMFITVYIYIYVYIEREICRFIYLGICKSHLGPLCEVLFGHQLLGLRKQWGPRGPVATAFGSWKSCELLELHQEISFWGHEKNWASKTCHDNVDQFTVVHTKNAINHRTPCSCDMFDKWKQ